MSDAWLAVRRFRLMTTCLATEWHRLASVKPGAVVLKLRNASGEFGSPVEMDTFLAETAICTPALTSTWFVWQLKVRTTRDSTRVPAAELNVAP